MWMLAKMDIILLQDDCDDPCGIVQKMESFYKKRRKTWALYETETFISCREENKKERILVSYGLDDPIII